MNETNDSLRAPSDTLEKLLRLDISGRQLIGSQEIQEHREFGENFQRRFSVSALPDEKSLKIIRERVVVPIIEIAKPLGIGYLVHSEEVPLHLTIQEAEVPLEDKPKKQDIFESLIKNDELREALKLTGEEIQFDYLLMGKAGGGESNLVMVARNTPKEIDEIRKKLSQVYESVGMKPIQLDLAHMTVARINRLPGNFDTKKRQEYFRQVKGLRQALKDPITVTIGDVYIGPTWDFIHMKRAADQK